MSLQGIYPAWLGETGTGEGPGGTVIIDAFTAQLSGDVAVEIDDDTILVTVEDDYSSEVDSDNIGGTVSGDIDVEVDCS